MGSGSAKEKPQQVAYQRDFLGSCWNSPYGAQEAAQYLPSRWMGLSKSVMELHTGNQCFVLRTVRFDEDAADMQSQNTRVIEDARVTVAAASGGGGGAGNGSFSGPQVAENSSFASLGGGHRLRRQLPVQQPMLGPSSPVTRSAAGMRKASGGGCAMSEGMPSPRGSVRDVASLVDGSDKDSSHGTEKERAKHGLMQTRTKTLTGRRKGGDTILRTVLRDAAELERALHNSHPYLKEHGLSIFPGVMFRAAPARRRYDRVSFVPTPVEVVQNYMQHIDGGLTEFGGGGGAAGRGGKRPDNGTAHWPLSSARQQQQQQQRGDDDEDDSSSPLPQALRSAASLSSPTPRMASSAPPPRHPTLPPPLGTTPDNASGSNIPTPLRSPASLAGQNPLAPGGGGGLLPPKPPFTLDPAAAVTAQLRRSNPLNPANNYPIEDADVPSVNAITPPIIVGSITAAELQALPANAEICLGGWLYVSLQDEQRRLRRTLEAYEEKLKKRARGRRPARSRRRESSAAAAEGADVGGNHEGVPQSPAASGTVSSPMHHSSSGTRLPSVIDLSAAAAADHSGSPLKDTHALSQSMPPPQQRMAVSCSASLEKLMAEDAGDNKKKDSPKAKAPEGGNANSNSQGADSGANARDTEEAAGNDKAEGDGRPVDLPHRQSSDPTFLRGAAAAAVAAQRRSRARSLLNRNSYFSTSQYPTSSTPFPLRDEPEPGAEDTWLPYAYLFVALPMYECSIYPTSFHMALQRSKPISLNLENPLSRRAYGVGCITSVRYGGVMIIECRDRVSPGDDDWVLYLIALGRERAKREAAAAARRARDQSNATAPESGTDNDDDDGGSGELKDDSLPFRSGWSLLLDPTQVWHSGQQRQRAEHLQAVKRRIRRRLKRLGLYVVSASTRAAVRQQRPARRFVQSELSGEFTRRSGAGNPTTTTQQQQQQQQQQTAGDSGTSDDEADKHRDGNSEDEDEDRSIRGEMASAKEKKQRGKRQRHRGSGEGPSAAGYLPSSESDDDNDDDGAGDRGDTASDASGTYATNRKAANERAFHRQRPQRMIRGTFRQLGGMCYLNAGALMDGCPVSEVVRAVEQWICNLLKVPVKARPLSLFLQRYEGLASALRMAGSHLASSATDTSGAVLLSNASFCPNGGGGSFASASGGGGGMLLAAGQTPSSPLARGPPTGRHSSLFPGGEAWAGEDSAYPYSPTSRVSTGSLGRHPHMPNGSLDSRQGMGNGSFTSVAGGNAGNMGGTGGGGGGGGGMAVRLTLPYPTWYTGPLDPKVAAVLPPPLEALIKQETQRSSVELPLAPRYPNEGPFTTVGPKTVAVATLHPATIVKVAGSGGGGATTTTTTAAEEAALSSRQDGAADEAKASPLPRPRVGAVSSAGDAAAASGTAAQATACAALENGGGPLTAAVGGVVAALDAEAAMELRAHDVAESAEDPQRAEGGRNPKPQGDSRIPEELHTNKSTTPTTSPNAPPTGVAANGTAPLGTSNLPFALPRAESTTTTTTTAAAVDTIESILMHHSGGGADAGCDTMEAAAAVLMGNASFASRAGNNNGCATGGVGGGGSFGVNSSLAKPGPPPPSSPHHEDPHPAEDDVEVDVPALAHANDSTTQPPSPASAEDAMGVGEATDDRSPTESSVVADTSFEGSESRAAAAVAAVISASGHEHPLSEEDEVWHTVDQELRKAKGELDEIQFLLANAKTELQERLEEYVAVGSLFLPHTRSDQIGVTTLFLKMLRHYPDEVPIKELRADWLPSLLALLTTPHDDMFARTATGALSAHLANTASHAAHADVCAANRRRDVGGDGDAGGEGLLTRYTIETFPPTPQILRTAHGLSPLARLREVTLAPLPYRVNPEAARALEMMGMDSGLSFVFTGGSLGVLAGTLTYYTDYVRRTFQTQLRQLRGISRNGACNDVAAGAHAPATRELANEHGLVAAAAASATNALELLEQTHTVLLQRVVVWGATTGKKGIKTLDEWQEMHEAYYHMLDPSAKAAESPTRNSPGYYFRKFAAAATGRGDDNQEVAVLTALLNTSGSMSSSRAKIVAKEMDLHAERVGIPFRAAECFALFDAIAYYLSTLESLQRQFSGAVQQEKPRKRRSLLKPFHKKGSAVSANQSRNVAEDDEVGGTVPGAHHPLLAGSFEITIATNYYYKEHLEERQQPQIIPASLLPAPPAAAAGRGGAYQTMWPLPRHPAADHLSSSSGVYHFPPLNETTTGSNYDGSASLSEANREPSTGGFASSGDGGVLTGWAGAGEHPPDASTTPPRHTQRRGSGSVPPSPCIMPMASGGVMDGSHRSYVHLPPSSAHHRATPGDTSHDDPVGWRRLVSLGGHHHHHHHHNNTNSVSNSNDCRHRKGKGGSPQEEANNGRGSGAIFGAGGGKGAAEQPKGNGTTMGCEQPYCGGEEEPPEGDVYAKLRKDAKKVHRFLDECLDKWKRQSESAGEGGAAYAKRIRIAFS